MCGFLAFGLSFFFPLSVSPSVSLHVYPSVCLSISTSTPAFSDCVKLYQDTLNWWRQLSRKNNQEQQCWDCLASSVHSIYYWNVIVLIIWEPQHWFISTTYMKWSESPSVMPNSLWPLGLYTGTLQARILEWVALPFSRGSSHPRDWTQVSCTAGGFLPAEPQRKHKKSGVGSLPLLQRIFLTQELNWCLLHHRRILYQLSYQGSPLT